MSPDQALLDVSQTRPRSSSRTGRHAHDFYIGPANILRGDTMPSATCYRYDGDSAYITADDQHEFEDHSLPESEPEFEIPGDKSEGFQNSPGQAHVSFQDNYIAFGTIQIYECPTSLCKLKHCPGTHIRGSIKDDVYPNILIKAGLNKKWLRMDGISIGTKGGITSLRVYILPEDVDRSNRGNTKDFRRMVKSLLPYVDCSADAWTGRTNRTMPMICYSEPVHDTEESLFYIFNTIESPAPDPGSYAGADHGYQAMVDTLEGRITGLKTELYSYQRRSVAAMIKKEQDPAKVRDPRKQRCTDVIGQPFYLDMNDGSLYRQRPLYYEPRGGILAETMGYGKTFICIALVMATRGHYPAIPTYCVEATHTEQYGDTPSLLSMAARKLKHQGLPWKNEFYRWRKAGYHYDSCIGELQKYVRSYNEPVTGSMNPSRKGKHEYTNIVQLCSATLIIVPPNLILQWAQEIHKHVDHEAIDVLVISASTDEVPAWNILVKYDIVLMSKSRFEQEYRDDDLNQGRGIRYAGKYKSPLTEVRWLRVICDEGHGFAGSSTRTNAMAMLDKMFIERRWVVSGTPAGGLHGIEVGLTALESPSSSSSLSRRQSFGSALEQRRTPNTQGTEAKDLERLRLIVCNFLKLQPWANKKGDDQANWNTYLAPRIGADNKRYSMPALREIMQTLIIRHRIQDVDCDLSLPPLHNTITYITPSYYDKLSINLFVMILTSNYVTSEREDEDYMFHPRNRGKLTTLINNLGHATFYWIGITVQNVLDTIEVGEKYLNKHIDTISDADGMLLTEAILIGRRALDDSGWKAFNQLHEMGTYIDGLPLSMRGSWALDGQAKDPLIVGTTQAREMQKHVQHKMQKDAEDPLRDFAQHGRKIMHVARQKAEEEQKHIQEKKVHPDQKDAGAIVSPTKRAPTTSTSSTKGSASSKPMTTPCASTADIIQNPCPNAVVAGFVSAKLTYLCNKIVSHLDEKTIVFYNDNNTAFFTAEALELLHVPFLIYANTLKVDKRAEYLHKFNTDTETKVLLMDLKHAALGLHVAVASRVYIISPIWSPALESQAIKRAHRIGQTRPVYVETLVLNGTFEEALINRRKEKAEHQLLKAIQPAMDYTILIAPDSDSSKETKGAMLDDSVMVKVLKDISFLKINDDEEKVVRLTNPMPLFKPRDTDIIGDHDIHEVRNDTSSSESKEVPPATPAHRSIFGGQATEASSSRLKRANSTHQQQEGSPPKYARFEHPLP